MKQKKIINLILLTGLFCSSFYLAKSQELKVTTEITPDQSPEID